jgi:hypothetical protein
VDIEVLIYGALVLRGGQDFCFHGSRRSFGGEIGRKEEVFLRAGYSQFSKFRVVGVDNGELAVVSGGEGLFQVLQGGV